MNEVKDALSAGFLAFCYSLCTFWGSCHFDFSQMRPLFPGGRSSQIQGRICLHDDGAHHNKKWFDSLQGIKK